MKKIVLIIFISLIQINFVFAQTETETIDWIDAKYNSFKEKGVYRYEMKLTHDGIIKHTIMKDYVSATKIKYKDIKSYSLKKLDNGEYLLQLYCKNDNKCTNEGEFDRLTENYKWNSNVSNISNWFRFEGEFGNDDLPKRFVKAIKHLIKLNGGIEIRDKSKEHF